MPRTYYDPLPISPGTHFIRGLVEAKISIETMKIPFPETIGMFTEKFYLSTGADGYCKITTDVREHEIMNRLEEEAKEFFGRDPDENLP